jgi:branched-subunit amino acid ABC-type transport system permease component
MMMLREIVTWICQSVVFMIGIGIAGLSAHLGGALVALAFDINDLIPTAVIFFAVAGGIGWIGNRFWPEAWLTNPLL